MIGPVIVLPHQSEASVEVGRMVVINVDSPTETVISTDRPDLLELSQGRYDGSAWFNPGAQTLAAGTATITVTQGDQTRTIAITVIPAAR